MSPESPTPNATSQGPSTKAWLLLMSLLTGLLLAGSRPQLFTRDTPASALVSRAARPAGTLPASRRVALKSAGRPQRPAADFAPTVAL